MVITKNTLQKAIFPAHRYNFAERYFLDASFRRDGSSRFSDPWGNFWSLGASWIISQEKFMKDLTWIDNLKFRVSYG